MTKQKAGPMTGLRLERLGKMYRSAGNVQNAAQGRKILRWSRSDRCSRDGLGVWQPGAGLLYIAALTMILNRSINYAKPHYCG